MTLTFDLLTSKSIGHILDSWGVSMWSFMMIGVKGKQLCAGNPNADGRTDGRTWWFQYTPPNFVAGGIMTEKLLNKHFHLVSPCDLDLCTPKCIQLFYKLLSTNWPNMREIRWKMAEISQNAVSGKEKKLKKINKKEKTIQQQKGLPTLSADLNFLSKQSRGDIHVQTSGNYNFYGQQFRPFTLA